MDRRAFLRATARLAALAALGPDPEPARHRFDGVDNWMGYVADRQAILDRFATTKNPVVLSGDSHVNFVYDLKRNFADPRSPTIGTEFLGTSISSEGDPFIEQTQFPPPGKNPQLRFFDTTAATFAALSSETGSPRTSAPSRPCASRPRP